jgi:hypothetical protein
MTDRRPCPGNPCVCADPARCQGQIEADRRKPQAEGLAALLEIAAQASRGVSEASTGQFAAVRADVPSRLQPTTSREELAAEQAQTTVVSGQSRGLVHALRARLRADWPYLGSTPRWSGTCRPRPTGIR